MAEGSAAPKSISGLINGCRRFASVSHHALHSSCDREVPAGVTRNRTDPPVARSPGVATLEIACVIIRFQPCMNSIRAGKAFSVATCCFSAAVSCFATSPKA